MVSASHARPGLRFFTVSWALPQTAAQALCMQGLPAAACFVLLLMACDCNNCGCMTLWCPLSTELGFLWRLVAGLPSSSWSISFKSCIQASITKTYHKVRIGEPCW